MKHLKGWASSRSVSFRESERYFPVHFRQFGPEYEWVETLTPTEVTKLGGSPTDCLAVWFYSVPTTCSNCVGFCGDFQSWIVALKSEGLEQRRILGGSVGRKQRHYGGALPLCLFENMVLPKSAGLIWFNDHHCISNGHTFGYPPFVALQWHPFWGQQSRCSTAAGLRISVGDSAMEWSGSSTMVF